MIALEASARASFGETFKRQRRGEHQHTGHDVPPTTPLRFGIEDNIAWGVVDSPLGPLNGYAWIPREGHPWSTVTDYDDDRLRAVEAHGGLTFCTNGWIGFDTLHAWDAWDPVHLRALGVELSGDFVEREWEHRDQNSRVWTITDVSNEARSLARQIAGAA